MSPRAQWNLNIILAAVITPTSAILFLHTGEATFALIFFLAIFLLYFSIIKRISLSL